MTLGDNTPTLAMQRLLLTLACLAWCCGADCTQDQLERFPTWPMELDTSLYWFDRNNMPAKAANHNGTKMDNVANYDPTKPTVIYFHGWTGHVGKNLPLNEAKSALEKCKRPSTVCSTKICPGAAPWPMFDGWFQAGWNVGFFYWDQFADEVCMRDAEQKIWFDREGTGLRWKSYNPANRTTASHLLREDGVDSVTDLCVRALVPALKDFAGKELRFVGFDIGAQLAARCATALYIKRDTPPPIISKVIGSVQVSVPTRLTLLEPYFSKHHLWFLTCKEDEPFKFSTDQGLGHYTAAATASAVAALYTKWGVIVEVYKSSLLTQQKLFGVVNDDLTQYATLVIYDPESCGGIGIFKQNDLGHIKCRHFAAVPFYFGSLGRKPAAGGPALPATIVKPGSALSECPTPSASCSNSQIRQWIVRNIKLGGKQQWKQVTGSSSYDTEDDTFTLSPTPTEAAQAGNSSANQLIYDAPKLEEVTGGSSGPSMMQIALACGAVGLLGIAVVVAGVFNSKPTHDLNGSSREFMDEEIPEDEDEDEESSKTGLKMVPDDGSPREFSDENESLTRPDEGARHHQTDGEKWAVNVAKGIYKTRWIWVIFWPAMAVVSVPPAIALLPRVMPTPKEAPSGTESFVAKQIFEEHFPEMSTWRRENVVFKCKNHCVSADNIMTRGLIEHIATMVARFGVEHPGTIVQVLSYYSFAEHHANWAMGNPMVSSDRQSLLLQWTWAPEEVQTAADAFVGKIRDAVVGFNSLQGPAGMEAMLTGLVTMDAALKEVLIEEIIVHECETIWLPFMILAFALQSPRMLLLALIPMGIELPVGLGLMYFVSLKTKVLLNAVEMMLMLMTSLSFDYALFSLTRYAEERRAGETVERGIVTVISQSGRVICISGMVLMISWAAMLGLPSMFMSFAVGACIMIGTCVLVQLTFTPSLLAILPFLGPPAAEKKALVSKGASKEEKRRIRMLANDPRAKACPHMKGFGFYMGGCLTAFPLNVLVPILVYACMSPLTLRFTKNFDFYHFKFKLGHSYANQIPRGSEEWNTALQIQRDFPNEMGVMMPMMVISTNGLPFDNLVNEATPNSTMLTNSSLEGAAPMGHLDVRGKDFFKASCDMLNALIVGTRNESFPLTADTVQSLTIHGPDPETGGVKCVESWQINFARNNFFAKKMFSHTNEMLNEMWDMMVSKTNNAMISALFPAIDPFGIKAFELARTVREVLENETLAMIDDYPDIPGLGFKTFSPATALLDLIDVTSGSLPVAFVICVAISFTLVGVWFGAWLAPLKSVMTVVIPISWTYGAALYVYDDGVLNWTGIPCFMALGYGTDWAVPIFTLTFLVGLALDYDVFLFERVKEFREEAFGPRESIQLGLAATGGTISAAGLIMALSFGGATLLGSVPVTNQMGFIFVFAISVDTFIVRTILVPALLSLSPTLTYWPSKLPTPQYEWLDYGELRPEWCKEKGGELMLVEVDEEDDGSTDEESEGL